ncbi:hypothetical protein ENSA5_00560 [Enhygromyxa salina]|uniref:IgGFc-binding protein N-terminal domain-containing protein n=1 Tax=Enhygromyxa salina TaxID=215803 RepID=A0A2S9YL28_9BACT|nr:IgGFc-binding protein [Enhygromyxa salina]PRQ05736.1 hypothetical protein ENSA5_00560 [Enhygromyxa salina]
MRRLYLPCSLLLLAACGDSAADDGGSPLSGVSADATSMAGSDSGDGDGDSDSGDGDGDSGDGDGDPGDGDGDDDGDDTSGIKFDMAALPDGGGDTGEDGPIIPETCDQAAAGSTTVGCLFYAVDLDQNGTLEYDQYAVAVSNVQLDTPATVTVEKKNGNNWEIVAGPVIVDPLDLYAFPLPDNHHQGSGVKADGSYRVSSDVPIIAYQFNPMIQGAASSDASMLYPVASWDYYNQVIHWGEGYGRGYVTIVAAEDGTVVEVTPVVATEAGPGVPSGSPNVPFEVMLAEGEIAEVMVATQHTQLTGTKVVSDEDHPIAVFSGHECAWIPLGEVACDHIEDQLSGVRLWGQNFAAGRVPVRWPDAPEASLWQIFASEDGTTVTITAAPEVTGLPMTPAVLNQGETLEFFAAGTPEHPGDLLVEADKPIAVANYMTGFGNLPEGNQGDPAMVQLAPFEQFLPRYVVLVPDQWINDVLVVTQPIGAEVTVDGVAIPPDQYLEFGGDWEAARYTVPDGVHQLEGTEPFSVVVVGFDGADSYAYLGGSSTGKINPAPQG